MIRRINDRLILIGVAHVLPESVVEVRETIQEENPNVVAVELCPARYFALTEKERRGSGVNASGLEAGILNWVLHFFQQRMAQQAGMIVGGEMLVAVRTSKKVGARVELIDRDMDITLQRFINRISQWEKLKFAFNVLFGLLVGEKIDFRKLTDEEVVERLVSELKEASEKAYEVFIRERDEFMAQRIVQLMETTNGKIVCAVGAGHVPGLYKRLDPVIQRGKF
ncbi:hypothetical protein AKJ58_01430 [candidate division MSBL1 archaeon SCGC-AAA385D11]|uniref:Conjugal transfer protein TraB n=1 Tax=candidate division MSBL1 archaeon SCGC-AAA385D11 TaxID=1698286 RepID=A0A133VND3_9EURY|nr:hypothetical protein AKJ58_01430 [candidate division MSBL1 archaeon SCGC-AAA385D11]